MRTGTKSVLLASAVVAVGAAFWMRAPSTPAQTAVYRAPRTADGTPDLNGVWQAVNTANYDIQAHPARPALALMAAPPRSGVPGLGRATHDRTTRPGGACAGRDRWGSCR